MARTPKLHLRAWREFRGLSQDAIADMLETSKGYYSQMERGERPVDRWLTRIAEALGIEVAQLLAPPASGPVEPRAAEPSAGAIDAALLEDVLKMTLRRLAGGGRALTERGIADAAAAAAVSYAQLSRLGDDGEETAA